MTDRHHPESSERSGNPQTGWIRAASLLALLLAPGALPATLPSATLERLVDVQTGSGSGVVETLDLAQARVGRWSLMAAARDGERVTLWATDGAPAGTAHLLDRELRPF
ncbi:MAG: hypothetical protein R3234_02355, partial [Thermoanaerobaculia bacterium]|nr:hypothetical protein [Thermoanaerobaculia bacterium]